MRYIFSLIACFILCSQLSVAQSNKQIDALNNVSEFINESIHGMLIAHRLLENYNQEINKYVDLEGYQINNFSNADLPKNIFEDPEHWFYERTPYELFTRSMQDIAVLPANDAKFIRHQCKILFETINNINRIRFTIPDFIKQNDLKEQQNIDAVYKLLEEATYYFDHFFEVQRKVEVALIKNTQKFATPNVQIMDVVKAFDDLWLHSKNILRSVRFKEDEKFDGQISRLKSAIAALEKIDIVNHPYSSLYSKKTQQSFSIILKKSKKLVEEATLLKETADVPQEYKLYGKYYYYHNTLLTTETNRYGFGIMHEMNKMIKNLEIPILYRVEDPHFYQVIYPKKLQSDDVIKSSDDEIIAIPKKLKDRTIISSQQTIIADTSIFEVSLYDYKIQDGDIVSINFNGDWILENFSLEGSKTKLKLVLNEKGKNYIILHAENEGRNPPNTMALSYKYKDEIEKITLSSNLNESAMIEIKYVPKNK